MAPKGARKSTLANTKVFVPPANAVPQPLPPSVEEAYRRKCCQLRHRYNQIEEHNDAARLRLHRLRRQLDKLRVERAFLLEQVSKRTSTNVEDSEGSPSPPPTPKEKPLRLKRGHRKPSSAHDKPDDPAQAHLLSTAGGSPSSETSSKRPNGVSSRPAASTAAAAAAAAATEVAPTTAFELYSAEMMRADEEGAAAADRDEGELAAEMTRRWEDLSEKAREEWAARFEEEVSASRKRKKGKKGPGAEAVEPEVEDDADTELEPEAEPEAEPEPEPEPEAEPEVEVEGDDNDVEMGGAPEEEDAEEKKKTKGALEEGTEKGEQPEAKEAKETKGDEDVEMDDADEKK